MKAEKEFSNSKFSSTPNLSTIVVQKTIDIHVLWIRCYDEKAFDVKKLVQMLTVYVILHNQLI